MPCGRIGFGRGIALAFGGADVEQPRARHVADVGEDANKGDHVVSVERAEIPDIESFEEVLLLGYERLDAVAEP